MSEKHILDDKITLKEIVLRTKAWINYFQSMWIYILISAIIGMALGATYSILKKPVYAAETIFVLEESDGSGLGQVSGLASLVGMNLSSLGGSSGLFQGDNIMELYKSNNMLDKTLLSPFDNEVLLIDRYIQFNKLDEKWKNKVDLKNMNFGIERSDFTVTQDSVMKEIAKTIKEKHLSVAKPDRKLTIIKVDITSKDEAFAKVFNEKLVENVNNFYLETKTKKTSENLNILQSQADSVRRILDRSLEDFASLSDMTPNPNPLLQAGNVGIRKKQVDVQATTAIYSEIVKNLEIAKVNQRNTSPLIQIIDGPRYPLDRYEIKLLKGLVFGGLIAIVLCFLALYIKELNRKYLKEI
ncbi:Wzz/FepE/Etk N-terminal domain-containing protein [Belliella kenyensis]|uniref:Wzz/FepE/Etk N-terminal domain-containing protein n=1 Tax=Belliella kenyensis TaxID=1472724 RepID=A0ABV8ENH6_9BACT|nr:Wzz/FepE/Etk N-terminal domain-containing protein [Belliella kenyensis]MCH7401636.1 Wzz/FepE/Etk N-terminal domain-containing protein [Belliella kenyensis]MDN3603086.1 Wzz/FepE/Etk N-terminal domain-containing protein [Belliella kenyensis]